MKAEVVRVTPKAHSGASAFSVFLSIELRKSLFWSNSQERKAVKIIAALLHQEQLVKAKWRLESK
ncbi:hypothetical protein [Cylindrospermum sp. FACHB-282]|uniref:hypothetical protein n=1 Tax=Cylindrospermum sp. FACHB-282 TaxID=2692794 RepID=UPI001688938B|nr:hypothetical protein [Cylindrospermum sp. FACHB-282]MBD2384714.1 hypothetical protein [Cylindrospermum sp. FACHB-282]